MVDTTKIADEIDGLADKEVKVGGMKLTFASIMAILAFISTVVGGLYGGFVLYQRIEAVAGLDLDEYQAEIILVAFNVCTCPKRATGTSGAFPIRSSPWNTLPSVISALEIVGL